MDTKYCSRCGESQDFSKFYQLKGGKIHCWCKSCCKKVSDGRAEYRAEFYKKNKEKIIINQVIYARGKRKNNPLKYLYKAARSRARKKDIPFSIEEGDLELPEYCPILGIKLEVNDQRSKANSPSIDKIIPELGYVKENVRIISWRANSIKNDSSVEEMKKLISFLEMPLSFDNEWLPSKQKNKAVDCLYFNAMMRAKNLNLPFEIEKSDIFIPKYCPALDIELIRGVGQSNVWDKSPTLDRINPSLGYVKGNIAVISYRANRIKNNATVDELRKILTYMEELPKAL